MTELSGAQVVARALQDQGINELFGLMGIPVVPVAQAAQRAGIRYIGTRHEAAAGYAAQAASYMSGHIGAALVVSGPGVTNAITTLGNAQENAWPMLLLGGSSALESDNARRLSGVSLPGARAALREVVRAAHECPLDPALYRHRGARGAGRRPAGSRVRRLARGRRLRQGGRERDRMDATSARRRRGRR